MGFLTNPWMILALLVALAGSHWTVYVEGKHAERADWVVATAKAEKAAHDKYQEEVERGDRISQKFEQEKTKGEVKARTIAGFQREISRLRQTVVPVEVVAAGGAVVTRCDLTVGAIRLHNAAAAGETGPPPAASFLDATPSGLAADTLAEACTANYAQYHQVAGRLRALQEWAGGPK